ncbi:ABC transporter substrate-binding protein [Stackebrandtia soli]|uniref:ABC transporter substrate-binding protein n=1 Tax=Stackebrandtia soli TaxID=1892856 RepID=UPI0039E88F0F
MSGSPNTRTSLRAVGALVSAALVSGLLAACTDEPPAVANVADEPVTGGTVTVVTESEGFESLDPQGMFIADLFNVSQLITRTLTTFTVPSDGTEPELVGDLATDVGTPNEDFTEWVFTLRDDVKWETGEEVTCADVRYGVLRSYDIRHGKKAQVDGGPPYIPAWLDIPDDYKGPRTDGDLTEDRGVVCDDDHTIRFTLKTPASNFPAAAAMPAFSPVPADADTWGDYGLDPVATGPYKLTEYEPATDGGQGHALFERNEHWDSETDPVREARPDAVKYLFGVAREYAAQQIVNDNPDYANAVMYQNVPANYVQQVVNDDELMAQTVTGPTSAIRYLAINTESVPDIECRKALVIGFNKRKFLDVLGGQIFGEYATTVLPPGDPGHADFDVFGLSDNPDGDLERAQQLLADAGDCPKKLSLDGTDTPTGKRLAESIQATYARLGITIELNLIAPDQFFGVVDDLDKQGDLTLAGWIADWPGGSGTLPAMYHGDSIINKANTNYARLDDADINELIDAANAAGNTDEAYELWGAVDKRIAEEAVTVPISHTKVLSLCGKNVRGAVLNLQHGAVDIASLGVAG